MYVFILYPVRLKNGKLSTRRIKWLLLSSICLVKSFKLLLIQVIQYLR